MIVNEVASSTEVPDGEKYALLASWDHVLGLDLEREATSGWAPSEEMRALMSERDAARAAKDFAEADEHPRQARRDGPRGHGHARGHEGPPRDQR